MKKPNQKQLTIIGIGALSVLFIGLLIFITSNTTKNLDEIYSNSIDLENYTAEITNNNGSTDAESSVSSLIRTDKFESVSDSIFFYASLNTINYGAETYKINYEFSSTKDQQYLKFIEEAPGDPEFPVGTWVEIPSTVYPDYNEENISYLLEDFNNSAFTNIIFDFRKLDVQSDKSNKVTFNVSENQDFKDYFEDKFSPIECYEDGDTLLSIQVEKNRITNYTIENDCNFIEYKISSVDSTSIDKPGK